MSITTPYTLETLLLLSARAYHLGEGGAAKQRTQEDLFDAVKFNLRQGYMPAVWQAYKAGRFAAELGDQ